MSLRLLLVLVAVTLGTTSGCEEQRIVLFDGSTGDSGPRDAAPDTLVLDASNRDPERCGPTAVHCQDDEYCVDGGCTCREELTRIGGVCIDTDANVDHCGAEGVACSEACADGECVATCPDETENCDGGCVEVNDDPLHCGECNRPCGSGRLCVGGDCVPFRPASCIRCPCELCGTRTCCDYPTTSDPICLDGPSCTADSSTEESEP